MLHLDDGELTAYLDGEGAEGRKGGRAEGTAPPSGLPTFGLSAPQQHLAECAECQARMEALRVTRERAKAILRSGTPSAAKPSFEDVLRRKRQQAAEGGRRIAGMRSLAWAATVVLALGVGWYARELSIRDQVPQGPTLVMENQPRLLASSDDSAPKLAARQTPVMGVQQETAGRRDGGTAGVASELSARTKETANVVAERKDEPAPAPASLAVDRPSGRPAVRLSGEEDQLKKLNAQDTQKLALDVVVVAAAPEESRAAAAASSGAGERVSRRARQAPSAAAPAPAPAVTRGFAAEAPATTAEWTRVDLSAATRVLDRAPFIAPGLDVVEYQVNASRTSVRVTQRLTTGILELIQQRAGVRDESGPSASRAVTGPGVGALVDGIQLRLMGPVSYDSLRALIAKLR